jgi:hypothetical protein
MDSLPANWAQDIENSKKFWVEHDANMRLSMLKVIDEATKKEPPLIYVHIEGGLSDNNLEKLSAYRVLAEEQGWEIGALDINGISHTVSAPMRRFPPK